MPHLDERENVTKYRLHSMILYFIKVGKREGEQEREGEEEVGEREGERISYLTRSHSHTVLLGV